MRNRIILLIIIFTAGIAYIPFLGNLHLFDWDEINFAESAREMILTHDYLTVKVGFEPFWEKPPLFIWLQVVSMKMFGVNEFAARFPNAMCGIITLISLFLVGKKLRDTRFALIWTLFFGCSVLPFTYFKSGIIDPWFNYFIFMSVFAFHQSMAAKTRKWNYLAMLFSGALLGLAVLTKGPAAIVIFGLTCGIYLVLVGFKVKLNFTGSVIFLVSLVIVGGFWFLLQIAYGHYDLLVEFVQYQIKLFRTQDSGHGGFPLYHFVILLFGVFPASVFAIQGHAAAPGEKAEQRTFRKLMIILFWTVLILFSIVKTKIVHYSSLTYFPITFLAAHSLYHILKGTFRFRTWMAVLLGIVAFVLGGTIIFLPIFDASKQWFIDKGYITHPFVIGNLQAHPGFNITEIIIGLFLLVAVALSIVLFLQKRIYRAFIIIAVSTAIFIYSTLLIVAPKIEKYSQNSLIEFCISLKGKDVYVHPFHKSFAVLFYPDVQPDKKKHLHDEAWLRTGDIDKPVYFVIRLDKKEQVLKEYPRLEYIGEKNGYVFCKRTPKSEN
jgi:4-amino-4-deoxy-L-arabinose transferase-like glycosyltransferase